MPGISGIVNHVRSRISENRTSIAIVSCIICYAGLLAGSDSVMFAGAFASLAAVRLSEKKGGEL